MKNLLNTDSLPGWKDKINDQLMGHSVINSFYYDPDLSYTPDVLDFYVNGGILRDGVNIIEISSSLLRLNNNNINWVVINTTTASEILEVYTDTTLPSSNVIPLYKVTVDGSFTVTEILDVRTWAVK